MTAHTEDGGRAGAGRTQHADPTQHDPSAAPTDGDLVVVTVGGVQQFIAESRSTADVAASSRIVQDLVRAALREVNADTVVMPVGSDGGLPNRVVLVVPPNSGEAAAKALTAAIGRAWTDLLTPGEVALPAVPGFPSVQWVVVPAGGGYAAQWGVGRRALTARKRVRTFAPYLAEGVERVCSLTGRWAALDASTLASLRVRRRRGEALSTPAVVKRLRRDEAYPSTWTLATGPYRRDVLDLAEGDGPQRSAVRAALGDLHGALHDLQKAGVPVGVGRLPGLAGRGDDDLTRWLAREVEGGWLVADSWDAHGIRRDHDLPAAPDARVCADGATAAKKLAAAVRDADRAQPSAYLAVLVLDADRMGTLFADETRTDLRSWQRRVSAALAEVGGAQRAALESGHHLGRLVYAGGDDTLGFAPVRTALDAAVALSEVFTGTTRALLPQGSVSAALVYFHASTALQSALAAAHTLLEQAKNRGGRPGFGAVVLRRGGERLRVARPWPARPLGPADTTPGCLAELVAAARQGLSGRLASELERDVRAMSELTEPALRRELRRLAARHGHTVTAPKRVGDALYALRSDGAPADPDDDLSAPARWAALARFIAAEGHPA